MPSPAPPRRHPRAFWSAMVVATLLLGGGALVAGLGFAHLSGPDGAVQGYFDALARADAPGALAFGTIPAGSRRYLTETVLRDQHRLAPINGLSVESTQQSGARAKVRVTYTVDFPGAAQRVADEVAVRRSGDGWRLVQVAVPTQLSLVQAGQRATVAGGAVPEGTILLFPGPAPVHFDTPYLQLRPGGSVVSFASGPTTQIVPRVSDSGQQATVAAVGTALRACLDGRGRDLRCPQPDNRIVPGTLKAHVVGSLADQLTIGIGFGAPGSIDVSGDVTVTGRYRMLTFTNRERDASGQVKVRLHAVSYALAPLRVVWTTAS